MKTLEDLAREAGIQEAGIVVGGGFAFPDGVARFAALIRAQALDEAAAIVQAEAENMAYGLSSVEAIRALKEST